MRHLVLLLTLILVVPAARAQKHIIRFGNLITPFYGPLIDSMNMSIRVIPDTWKHYIREAPSTPENRWWSARERAERENYDPASAIFYLDMMLGQAEWRPMMLRLKSREDGDYELTIAYVQYRGETKKLLRTMSEEQIDQLLNAEALPSELKIKAMQKVIVQKEDDGWKLRGFFQENVSKLERTTLDDLEFFYHPKLQRDPARELAFARSVISLCGQYDLPRPAGIKAYLTSTRKEMLEMLGLYHIEYKAESFAIPANREVFLYHGKMHDEHEIAHILFGGYDSTMCHIINEGIATYVAHLNTPYSYKERIERARDMLRGREKPMTLHAVSILQPTDELSTLLYASGAWLCARVAEKHGIDGLKKLLSNSRNIPEMKETLAPLLGETWEETELKWASEFY